MCEHVFLCGLSTEQRAECPSGTALSLEKRVGNLKLELDRMRGRLVGDEPARLTDFIEIASYVFAADRMTKRGALYDPGFGAEWRRAFYLVIAVRDVSFWCGAGVKDTLAEALTFLSEDTWRIEFVENRQPIPLQQYLKGLKEEDPYASGGTSIVLFSGGLDSLAGAVHELRHTNRHVVLVSHLNTPGIGRRQKLLAKELAASHPGRVTHVWVNNSLTGKLDCEKTQRTRSFFFTAMAAIAAHIQPADSIRFYENGVMSVNLPIATQVVGARSSRSTHPRSLQLLDRVVDMIALHPIKIDNPFIRMTKIEVVRELAKLPEAKLITSTVSCTRARTVNRRYQPHCGTCVQCLQRRISTLAGNAGELDESEGYETDFLRGPREDGHDRVMALQTVELALDCAAMSERDFLSRFAGPVSWVLQAFPAAERDDVTKKIIDLFRRHGIAVRALLIDAAKPMLPDVIDGTLPPESLLALIIASRLPTSGKSQIELPADRLPEPATEDYPALPPTDDVVIAVDEINQRILIRNQRQLYGSAIFPIMKLLIEVSLAERSKPGLPASYRSLRAKGIADKLQLADDDSVRSAVRRAREELQEAAEGLGFPIDQNALIESTKSGYRLNPMVKVVTVEEIQRQ